MNKMKLPVGIQSFDILRSKNNYYVDKTKMIYQLISDGHSYFLSRPRRFGKSLLIDTIRCLYTKDKKPLFEGLFIYDKWDWSDLPPVIRMSFGGGTVRTTKALEARVLKQLRKNEKIHGIPPGVTHESDGPEKLEDLLEVLYEKTGKRAVVLIDEYDKPILDVLHNPDIAKQNRNYLKDFYSILKDNQDDLDFLFITGISLLSKLNLFSGINNLEDISMMSEYSGICGYTEHDLNTVFAPETKRFDLDKIRRWYDGYCWHRSGEGYVFFKGKISSSPCEERYWRVAQHLHITHMVALKRLQSTNLILFSVDV